MELSLLLLPPVQHVWDARNGRVTGPLPPLLLLSTTGTGYKAMAYTHATRRMKTNNHPPSRSLHTISNPDKNSSISSSSSSNISSSSSSNNGSGKNAPPTPPETAPPPTPTAARRRIHRRHRHDHRHIPAHHRHRRRLVDVDCQADPRTGTPLTAQTPAMQRPSGLWRWQPPASGDSAPPPLPAVPPARRWGEHSDRESGKTIVTKMEGGVTAHVTCDQPD